MKLFSRKPKSPLQDFSSNLDCINHLSAVAENARTQYYTQVVTVPLATLGIPSIMAQMLISGGSAWTEAAKIAIFGISVVASIIQRQVLQSELNYHDAMVCLLKDERKSLRQQRDQYTLPIDFEDEFQGRALLMVKNGHKVKGALGKAFHYAAVASMGIALVSMGIERTKGKEDKSKDAPYISPQSPPSQPREDRRLEPKVLIV